jgi:hypothetical protein
MLSLSDQQLDQIFRAAQPLRPQDRGPFMQAVASLLHSDQPGDGDVFRAGRAAQRNFFNAPLDTSHEPQLLRSDKLRSSAAS